MWGTLFGACHAKEVSLLSTVPPWQVVCNHRDTGEAGEWRPSLLHVNPFGHRIPATLFIATLMINDMCGDHYKMISKVGLGVNRPGGGCRRCVGVNIAWTPRWFRERGVFRSYAPPSPLQRAKMFQGCWGQGLHLGAPHGCCLQGQRCSSWEMATPARNGLPAGLGCAIPSFPM